MIVRQPPENLTRRELEVLQLLAEGLTTRAAAERLGIAFKTVRCHRGHILEKLGAHNTASMLRKAAESGLLQPAVADVDPEFYTRLAAALAEARRRRAGLMDALSDSIRLQARCREVRQEFEDAREVTKRLCGQLIQASRKTPPKVS